ncbi:hypothetical protein [Streptomyces sp. NPDC005283]|uniref:hypothetical protein n=1 Tax=Streptomyces sp. NPDC005283 TaxID=3156871 RepID=UPI0034522064
MSVSLFAPREFGVARARVSPQLIEVQFAQLELELELESVRGRRTAGRISGVPVLYALLYGRCMSKSVTIRVDDQLHALLKERAEAESTTVTALIMQAARDAVRDPRLEGAADVFRSFIAEHSDAFDAAFPDDAPGRAA